MTTATIPLTLTIDRDHSYGFAGFKAIVKLDGWARSVQYGFRTVEAARTAGERYIADQQPVTVGEPQSFRVSPVRVSA